MQVFVESTRTRFVADTGDWAADVFLDNGTTAIHLISQRGDYIFNSADNIEHLVDFIAEVKAYCQSNGIIWSY